MLRKLITFAVTTGLAKKAYDMYRERRQLDAMARDIEPQAEEGKAQARGRRAGGKRRGGERAAG